MLRKPSPAGRLGGRVACGPVGEPWPRRVNCRAGSLSGTRGPAVKLFHCPGCGAQVFFENTSCVACGANIGFDLDSMEMVSSDGPAFRACENGEQHGVCNWVVPTSHARKRCPSCELTEVIPDLSVPGNPEAWAKIEEAKRRLIYNLAEIGLRPFPKKEDSPEGLAFRFLGDPPTDGGETVLTGHSNGIVTLNIAEADDPERERRRTALGEPYRTLIGHLRHEVGHYYWDRLISGKAEEEFRRLFGDERKDYAEALRRHYREGAAADWRERHISAYASVHPWEDWAETWAHYLHMRDALETAKAAGLGLGVTPSAPGTVYGAMDLACFDLIEKNWPALSCVVNNFSRSLGMPDAYPFVLVPAVFRKLRFIHEIVTLRN